MFTFLRQTTSGTDLFSFDSCYVPICFLNIALHLLRSNASLPISNTEWTARWTITEIILSYQQPHTLMDNRSFSHDLSRSGIPLRTVHQVNLQLNFFFQKSIFGLSRSNDNDSNWIMIYRGNQTQFYLRPNLLETRNASFRLYVANQHGRQEQNYSEIEIDGQ